MSLSFNVTGTSAVCKVMISPWNINYNNPLTGEGTRKIRIFILYVTDIVLTLNSVYILTGQCMHYEVLLHSVFTFTR